MMIRKLSVLGVVGGVFLTGAALSWARDDEKSTLQKAMEKVSTDNSAILKAVRNKANYTKNRKNLEEAAKEIVKLVKESRSETGPAKKEKQPQSKWEELVDSFVKEGDKYVELVAKPGTTQEVAKDKYKAVSASCTECHKVFRKDEDE